MRIVSYSTKGHFLASLKTLYKHLAFLGLTMILAACSVEKNTDATRFYHGMTSRYNIYFNGYESFKAGLARISNGYRDDYAELLKVFEYSDPSTVSLCSSDMDKAIQKAAKVISLKSITAKPEIKNKRQPSEKEKKLLDQKEFNEWIDDSYLLIAKAHFYKHEYNEATSVVNYCIAEANDPVIRTEATIWLARIYNETNNHNESLRVLKELDITSNDSRAIRTMYNTTLADLFIKQKRYSEAIDPLSKSLEDISTKRTKYRLTYLLAQLFELSGDGARSTSLYRKVVKMNPPYEVEFNARINIAGVFDINTENPVEIRRELEKMLKDAKNKDYHDQIYYALGNMSMKEGNDTEAVDFYKKSASTNSQNQNQKGKTYLALADYYYKKLDYMNAGKYYDSTVFFLDQKNISYNELKAKSLNLNSLVSQLTIIQHEDSLQKVASMSPNERDALIASIIAEINKAESEGKTSQYTDRYNQGQFYENQRRSQGNIDQEGKWYFYNQAALTFGRTEFRRRWGDRKLEDNWRRSNKAQVSILQTSSDTDETTKQGTDSSSVMVDYKKPEFYLKDLPLTDSLLNISNEKIANAMLNAGKAYSERIHDPIKATETFETLINRFPESELIPESLYNLYKTNIEGNKTKAETYRQRLLERYSESEFAKILSDPDYYKKVLANHKLIEELYQEAFDAYSNENFNGAISICNDALKKYPQNILAPKFMLLNAYSVARISDERNFKEELNKIIKTWPETDESKKAQELVAFLNMEIPELKIEEDKEIAKELFRADTTEIHSFVLIINDPAFNINQATFDVISYNIDNFTNKNYKTVGSLVDNKYIMITVSGFEDYMESFNYFKAFMTDKLIRNPGGSKMMTFVINNDNLNVLNEDKNPMRYNLFFKENYLK